jgi:septal ring factor EnvC (AmiA/AmiB activator)
VHQGESVSAKQVIGVVNTDDNGISELDFQVWNQMTKQNPEQWLNKQ